MGSTDGGGSLEKIIERKLSWEMTQDKIKKKKNNYYKINYFVFCKTVANM